MNRITIGKCACTIMISICSATSAQAHGSTERVSISSRGVQANLLNASDVAISVTGRFVFFSSFADNLIPNDTNDELDIFSHDRFTGVTVRESIGFAGVQSDGQSYGPVLSTNLRFIAFASNATNLVSDDRNSTTDVFVRDRKTGRIERTTRGIDGHDANGVSFVSDISADGRLVAFRSAASNLVRHDTNGQWDVFVHDRISDATERVNVGRRGVQSNGDSSLPSLSANGRFVAFASEATNLVLGDTNGFRDVFVRDRQTDKTVRVSVGLGGAQTNDYSYGDPTISADGRFVAFDSDATNIVPGDTNGFTDVFVYDRVRGTTRRLSVGPRGRQGNQGSYGARISQDGQYVAFDSYASNLVSGDTNEVPDVFIQLRKGGVIRRVSLSSSGIEGDFDSGYPALSGDGHMVAFYSEASNLVKRDTNFLPDVFVRTLRPLE